MSKIVTIFLFVLKHFTSTKIRILNTHSKSEYVFYYTMKANFVVLARFLLNFVTIIEASKSVSSCQLFLLPPGFEPGTLTPRVSMFSITPQKLILLYWLDFYFCYCNFYSSKSVSSYPTLYFHQDLNLEPSLQE